MFSCLSEIFTQGSAPLSDFWASPGEDFTWAREHSSINQSFHLTCHVNLGILSKGSPGFPRKKAHESCFQKAHNRDQRDSAVKVWRRVSWLQLISHFQKACWRRPKRECCKGVAACELFPKLAVAVEFLVSNTFWVMDQKMLPLARTTAKNIRSWEGGDLQPPASTVI